MAFKGKKKQKAAAGEFTDEMLPHNRRQQFYDCIKVRFVLFIRIGIMLLLFLVPCIIVGVYRDFTLIGFGARLSAGEITREQYFKMQTSVNMIVSAINIVCMVIASLGFAGAARIIRQLVWGEAVFFRDDFITGIKSNGKSYALTFFLAGVVICIDTIVAGFRFPVEIIKYIPYGVSVIFLLPIALFLLSQSVIYKNRAVVFLKNSCILYIKSAPKTLLFVLALTVFVFAEFIPLVFIKYALYVLAIIFALPLFMLAWTLFSVSLFDKYMNKEQYPDLYMRGLYKPKD